MTVHTILLRTLLLPDPAIADDTPRRAPAVVLRSRRARDLHDASLSRG